MSSHREYIKRSKEKALLLQFLSKHPVVLPEQLIDNEKTVIDFLFDTPEGIVGIEATRAITREGELEAKKESFLKAIIQEAKEKYSQKSDLNLYVNIHFWEPAKINKRQRPMIVSSIIQRLSDNKSAINNANLCNHVKILIPNEEENIGAMYVFPLGELPAKWQLINPNWLLQRPYLLLQKIICKKHKKLKHYEKCHKTYLLITADIRNQAEGICVDEDINSQTFYSLFDKVFLWDEIRQKDWELPIVKDPTSSPIYQKLIAVPPRYKEG